MLNYEIKLLSLKGKKRENRKRKMMKVTLVSLQKRNYQKKKILTNKTNITTYFNL